MEHIIIYNEIKNPIDMIVFSAFIAHRFPKSNREVDIPVSYIAHKLKLTIKEVSDTIENLIKTKHFTRLKNNSLYIVVATNKVTNVPSEVLQLISKGYLTAIEAGVLLQLRVILDKKEYLIYDSLDVVSYLDNAAIISLIDKGYIICNEAEKCLILNDIVVDWYFDNLKEFYTSLRSIDKAAKALEVHRVKLNWETHNRLDTQVKVLTNQNSSLEVSNKRYKTVVAELRAQIEELKRGV